MFKINFFILLIYMSSIINKKSKINNKMAYANDVLKYYKYYQDSLADNSRIINGGKIILVSDDYIHKDIPNNHIFSPLKLSEAYHDAQNRQYRLKK